MKVKTNIRAGSGGASGVGGNSAITGVVDTTVSGNGSATRAALAAAAAASAAAYYASPAYQTYLANVAVSGRCVGI